MSFSTPILFLGTFPGNKKTISYSEPDCNKKNCCQHFFDWSKLSSEEQLDEYLTKRRFCPSLTELSLPIEEMCKLCQCPCRNECLEK